MSRIKRLTLGMAVFLRSVGFTAPVCDVPMYFAAPCAAVMSICLTTVKGSHKSVFVVFGVKLHCQR